MSQEEKHYSEQILDYMVENLGWSKDGNLVEKRFANVAKGGQFDETGTRTVYVGFCEQGRYIEAMLGFDNLVDLDCRDFDSDEAAMLFDDLIKEKLYGK